MSEAPQSFVTAVESSPKTVRKQRWARAWWALSVSLGLVAIGSTAWQPDTFAALTLIPVWCWLVAGVAAAFLARRLRPRRWLVLLALAWTTFAIAGVEECRSLSRSARSRFFVSNDVEAHRRGIRVTSLNCADGALRTAREAAAMNPDILLFQESPGRDDLQRLATELFGNSQGVLWSSDTSIIARWPVEQPEVQDHFVAGLVQHPSGAQIKVVSLRLAPPVVRYDLWNSACWREQTAKRQQHAKQVEQLVESLTDGNEHATILGGDFNAAQHDRATWRLHGGARDTFDVAGRGWGNTVLNTIPVLRFDQIWASQNLRVTATWAVRSRHSDHRLVVTDLVLTDNSPERGRDSRP